MQSERNRKRKRERERERERERDGKRMLVVVNAYLLERIILLCRLYSVFVEMM